MSVDSGTTCARHPRRPSLTNCVTCGRGVCADCVVRTPVGTKCTTCTGTPAAGHGAPSRHSESAASRPPRSRRGDPVSTASGPDARGSAAPPPPPGRRPPAPQRRGRRPGGAWASSAWWTRAVAAGSALAVVVIAVVGYHAINGGSSPGKAPPHTNYGATELAVQFTGGGAEQISGSLVLPDKRAAHAPAVLIVPDAEATDRDGYHSADASDLLYKDLAQALAAKGIASLRYDSRGHGQSVLLKATTVRLEDMVADARAGVAFLTARSDINPHKVAVLGHAAGGLVALSAAGQNPSVSAVALVSTPGRPAIEGMAAQLEATAPSRADGDAAAAQLRSIATGLAAGIPIPGTAALATPLRPVLTSDRNAYFKSLFAVDPVALAGSVHVPVLVVRGATDPAVTADDSQHLITAMGTAAEEFVGATDDHTLRLPKPGVGATPADEMAAMHSGLAFEPPPRDDAALTNVATWLAGKLGQT